MLTGVVFATLMLSACRADDLGPDVFIDEAHCGRDPDAAPFGVCDVVLPPDADASIDGTSSD